MARPETRRARPFVRTIGLSALSIGLALAVVMVALDRSAPPARCAAGMTPLGARCCGEGQTLAGDRCVGKPERCAAGLEVTEAGCVARPRAVGIAAGLLRIGPSDWEAQGQVTPRAVPMEAFAIDAHEVTEARYAACVAASACAPLPMSEEPGRALSRVTSSEARVFCAWAGGALPTPEAARLRGGRAQGAALCLGRHGRGLSAGGVGPRERALRRGRDGARGRGLAPGRRFARGRVRSRGQRGRVGRAEDERGDGARARRGAGRVVRRRRGERASELESAGDRGEHAIGRGRLPVRVSVRGGGRGRRPSALNRAPFAIRALVKGA